jgi:hypothetical protein
MNDLKNNEINKEVTFFDLISQRFSYESFLLLDFIFFTFTFLSVFSVTVYFYLDYSHILIPFTTGIIVYTLSMAILKPHWLYLKPSMPKKGKKVKVSKKLLFKKFLTVIFRITFFNVLYYLFPIFIIVFFGVLLAFFMGLMHISNVYGFIQMATLVSIVSGFFQYYTKRYEEKVMQSVSSKLKIITNIIVENASFKKFRNFLEKHDSKYKNISREIDRIFGKSQTMKLFNIVSKLQRTGGGHDINLFAPQFLLHSQHESMFFSDLETQIEEKYNYELIEAYEQFFMAVKEESKIKIKKIEPMLSQVGLLLFSNINIILESEPAFIETLYNIHKIQEDKQESYADFLQRVNLETLNEVLTKITFK